MCHIRSTAVGLGRSKDAAALDSGHRAGGRAASFPAVGKPFTIAEGVGQLKEVVVLNAVIDGRHPAPPSVVGL